MIHQIWIGSHVSDEGDIHWLQLAIESCLAVPTTTNVIVSISANPDVHN